MIYSRSDYSYRIEGQVIEIKDLNLGRVSVTNNIENIVEEIKKESELLRLENYLVYYKDSDGDWMGWCPKEKFFYPGPTSSTIEDDADLVFPRNHIK